MAGAFAVLLLLAAMLVPAAGCRYVWPAGERAKAVRMLESDRPDERREAVNMLLHRAAGQREVFVRMYREMAESETEPLARATAIRALNRSRDEQSTPLFVQGLRDPNPAVRLESAKALANLPDPDAAATLIALLSDTEQPHDIRIAAADALRHYSRLDVGRALAAVLGDRQFGVAWQARQSLVALTDTDHAYNEAGWLRHLTTADRPFVIRNT